MTFVFQEQRWKKKTIQSKIGPCLYSVQNKANPKLGYFRPIGNQKVTSNKRRTPQTLDEQLKMQISTQLKQNKQPKNQIFEIKKKKCNLSRSQSAKTYFMKNNKTSQRTDYHQQSSYLQKNNIDLSVQNGNAAYHQKGQFKNQLLRNQVESYQKKYMNQQVILDQKTKNTFNNSCQFLDSNLRMKKSNVEREKKLKKHTKSSTLKSLSKIFVKQNKSSNPLLINFLENKKQTQNNFNSNSQQNKQIKHNFIIASEHCTFKKFTKETKNKKNQKNQFHYQDMQTTGLSESQQSSMQFITEDTPGPGYYETQLLTTQKNKFIQNFGITQERFSAPKTNNQNFYNTEKKQNKITSRAPQTKVAFGISRPTTPVIEKKQDLVFYQNPNSLENRCIKNLLKQKNSPASFFSKAQRFIDKKPEIYNGPDFLDFEEGNKVQLPNAIFMSEVKRQYLCKSPTTNVDFKGQQCNTLKKKLEKSKQKLEYLEKPFPGFSSQSTRFRYTNQSFQKEKKMNKKTHKETRIPSKVYSFSKQKRQNHIGTNKVTQTPSPGSYNIESKWLSPSFHVKYKSRK